MTSWGRQRFLRRRCAHARRGDRACWWRREAGGRRGMAAAAPFSRLSPPPLWRCGASAAPSLCGSEALRPRGAASTPPTSPQRRAGPPYSAAVVKEALTGAEKKRSPGGGGAPLGLAGWWGRHRELSAFSPGWWGGNAVAGTASLRPGWVWPCGPFPRRAAAAACGGAEGRRGWGAGIGSGRGDVAVLSSLSLPRHCRRWQP